MFETQHIDIWYGALLSFLLSQGDRKGDRTGTGTMSVSGGSVRFDLQQRFPALSLKKTNLTWAFDELEWFARGDCSNIRWLRDERGCPIWNEWADANGNVGPIYGCQWRHWQVAPIHIGNGQYEAQPEVDQLAVLLNDLVTDPWARRMIVEGWNPALLPARGKRPDEQAQLGRMALSPCHKSFQCIVQKPEDPTLDLVLYQRSSDVFLGLPFNIAQYAYLTHALARYAGMKPGTLIVHFGDMHLYQNHVSQACEVVNRWQDMMISTDPMISRPQLVWKTEQATPVWDVNTRTDFEIIGYNPMGFIKAPVSV